MKKESQQRGVELRSYQRFVVRSSYSLCQQREVATLEMVEGQNMSRTMRHANTDTKREKGRRESGES